MPKSKSKSSARAARSGGLPAHPALANPDPLLKWRLGSEHPLRLPDHYNQPTAATVLRGDYTVSSDASGHAVFGESSDLYKITYTVTAGALAAAAGVVAVSQRASFLNSARYARQTGIKVQVTYIGAEQTSAGYLSGMTKAALADLDSFSIDAVHTGAHVQGKAADGMSVHQGPQNEANMQDPSAAGFSNVTYPIIIFAASGLPLSTPVFRVRVWRFMEFIPKEGDLFEGELQSEPHDPAALAVHGQLAGPGTSFFGSHMAEKATALIKGAANASYHIVQPMVGAYVRDRARGYLSGMAANAGMLAIAAL